MTDIVVQPEPGTAQPEVTLAVEAVQSAAVAGATASTALEVARETSGDVEALENEQAEIAAEIERVESWQNQLTQQMGTISETVASLTTNQAAMSEVLQALVARLTPPQVSLPSEEGGAPAIPSEEVREGTHPPSEQETPHAKRPPHDWV